MRRAFRPSVIEGGAGDSPSCIDDDAAVTPSGDRSILKPSVFYFRRDIRLEESPERLRDIALAIVAEHERLRAWCQQQGLAAPKWMIAPDEAREKGWS